MKLKNKNCGTQVSWKYSSRARVPWTWVLWMELEFQKKKKKNSKFNFTITQLVQNWVLQLKLDF